MRFLTTALAVFIILTGTQAANIKGVDSVDGGGTHRLDPVPLANGTDWVVNLDVLSDPSHNVTKNVPGVGAVNVKQYLSSLPQRDVQNSEFPQ